MLKILIVLGLAFISIYSKEVVVDANKEPYSALKDVFAGGIETSDNCDDKVKHITTTTDPILGRKVFHYSLHVDNSKKYADGDRCNGDYSRQRC